MLEDIAQAVDELLRAPSFSLQDVGEDEERRAIGMSSPQLSTAASTAVMT